MTASDLTGHVVRCGRAASNTSQRPSVPNVRSPAQSSALCMHVWLVYLLDSRPRCTCARPYPWHVEAGVASHLPIRKTAAPLIPPPSHLPQQHRCPSPDVDVQEVAHLHSGRRSATVLARLSAGCMDHWVCRRGTHAAPAAWPIYACGAARRMMHGVLPVAFTPSFPPKR